MIKKTIMGAAAALCLLAAGQASAALYNAPVASNAYITIGGLDWAWASPIAEAIDFTFQGAFGWRAPTATELLAAPLGTAFQFVGANVNFLTGTDAVSGSNFQYNDASHTGDAACAAAYFSAFYSHCDWGNAPGTLNDPRPWAGQAGAPSYAETLVVRVAAVPVPASIGLLGLAIASLVGMRRRRS